MIRNLLLLLAIALLQLPGNATPDPSSFSRYRRSIAVATPGQTCAVIDAATFAHAAPFLKDLRLYASGDAGAREVPYVITLSEAQQAESEPARILNLGTRGHTIDFDLAMPSRPYTEIVLDLAGRDFVATATVTGSDAPRSPQGTHLGDFTLFDLTAQHLARSTSLHLQESSFPYLHITLTTSPAGGSRFTASPQMVRGASVPPSREAQTLFTVAAQTSTFAQRRSDTLAHLALPERVPIERVTVALRPAFHENFSRDVTVSAHSAGTPASSGDSVSGTIARVKLTHAAREIPAGFEVDDQQLSFPAILGANLQSAAEVDVSVHNGNDTPLPIASVQLEMRQRRLCFQAARGEQFTLFYGDPELAAPVYDFARTYTPAAHSALVQLGPQELNAAFQPRPDDRPFTERHPQLLWLALLAVVCSLALVAFRSSRVHHHHPR